MDFLKKHWSTLILISLVASYLGISIGSNSCPMCLVFGSGIDKSRANVIAAQAPETMPEWQATRLDGSTIASTSEKGKVTVLVYWATWCPPCLEEIPDLIELRNDFPHEEVSIIGVSLDSPGKDLLPFVESNHINYDIARQTESLENAFGPIRYIPTMFIIDRDGRVRHQHTGIVGKNAIHAQIRALINAASNA